MVVGISQKGHTIYGDPKFPNITFTNSSPRNHIDPTYYSRANKVARDIDDAKKNNAVLIEPFTQPIIYESSYAFWAVHRQFADGIHGIFVPDIDDAIAAGSTFEEAKANAIMKLSSELHTIKELSKPIPLPSTRDHVVREGQKIVKEQSEEHPIITWNVLYLQEDVSSIPKLTDIQLATIYSKVMEIADEVRSKLTRCNNA